MKARPDSVSARDGEGHERFGRSVQPAAPLSVRLAIAKRIVRWSLPPMFVSVVLTFLLLYRFETGHTRYYPTAAWLLALVASGLLARAERWLASAAVLVTGLALVTGVSVLLHSVHSLGFVANLALMVLVVPLFGRRWGMALVGWALLTGALWFVLHAYGLTGGPRVNTPISAYLFTCLLVLLMLIFVSIPTRLLAEALHAAEARALALQQARAAEAKAELAFRALFDQTAAAVMLLHPDGKIDQLNARAAAWFFAGAARPEDHRLTEASFWTDQERGQLEAALQAARSGEESRVEITRAQGRTQRVYDVRLSPFRGQSGAPERIIVEATDVTALVEARTQLAHARRLEALGQLSGGVAHDFNNMLSAIMGATEMIANAHPRGQHLRVDTGVDILREASSRAADLTRKLLAFGRQERMDPRVLELNALVQNVLSLMRPNLGSRIELEVSLSKSPLWVRGDSSALEHALLNLLINARDAMPEGGTLQVETGERVLDEAWCSSVPFDIKPGASAVITVRDTGVGIPESERERIFEPFYTTKPEGKGTGLGLSAVHGTVVTHGGALDVESAAGEGSAFRMYLPLCEPLSTSAEQAGQGERPRREPASGSAGHEAHA